MTDYNNYENYFKSLISGFLMDITNTIQLNGKSIPHLIPHTGDDTLYLMDRGYDNSIEPCEVSNQGPRNFYQMVPRGMVKPSGININNSDFTSPFTHGLFSVIDEEDKLVTYSAVFRRIPLTFTVEITYVLPTYFDMLNTIQSVLSNCYNIRTFSFVYLGQTLSASYKLPDNFDGQYQMDIDGSSTDAKEKIINISLEIESNFPAYDLDTLTKTDKVILYTKANINQ